MAAHVQVGAGTRGFRRTTSCDMRFQGNAMEKSVVAMATTCLSQLINLHAHTHVHTYMYTVHTCTLPPPNGQYSHTVLSNVPQYKSCHRRAPYGDDRSLETAPLSTPF